MAVQQSVNKLRLLAETKMGGIYLVCSTDDDDCRRIEVDLKAKHVSYTKLTNPEAGPAMLYTPEGAFNSSAAAKMYFYLRPTAGVRHG